MGQCNSSAVQCCEPCSKSGQPRDILWQGAPARPSSTGKQVIKTSVLPTQSAHSSAAVPRQKSTLQLSVSLDQQSDHSVCIRVELLDGQSVLLDTTLHTSNTSDTTPARNTSSSFPPKEIVASSDEPNKSHYKDIHFSANKPEPALGPLQQLQVSESSLPNLLDLNKPPSRRTAFQQDECPTARLAASDGALLNTAKNRRHPMAIKENSWYHLGYASGMEESSQSLDFEGAMLSTSNNPSGHTQETKNSWGGISVKKSMNRMSLSSSTSSSNKDSNGKAQFPPIDISMNDISGNTLPTRFDYQDCQDLNDDDVSETEDDDEMDLSWDYHRNIRSLTSELDTPPFPPGLSHTDSSSSLGRRTPCSALSSSTPEASPPSFISNLSSAGRPQSYACRHRHSSTFLSHVDCSTNDNMMMMNNHSNRSCQSDSYVVVVRRKTDESTTQTSRLPWNPHQLPAF
ncbi:expressed unknown protein [Seminavis robusta]|uniref:Uncharacterized protein n=1 Tax=Seminavis robusta TaxID=568900 RepID=A0A9N8F1Q7_9STRA|nr:expressed unknown protein [Seminavis robusta]|eukprot:Sro2676_g334400.1 n/a (457) ;mRNA; r:2512-3983